MHKLTLLNFLICIVFLNHWHLNKDKRADIRAVTFHLALHEEWVAAVTLYAESSSLGACYDRFARCSLFSRFCFLFLCFLIASREVELNLRSSIFYQSYYLCV